MAKYKTIETTLEAEKILEVGAVIDNVNHGVGSGSVETDGKPHELHGCQPVSFFSQKLKLPYDSPKTDAQIEANKQAEQKFIAARDAGRRILPAGLRADVGDYYVEIGN